MPGSIGGACGVRQGPATSVMNPPLRAPRCVFNTYRLTKESGTAMNISARCEYACRAMTELSGTQETRTPVTSLVIAEKRGIPDKYLVHILLQLKRAGLVHSVRGAQGGYVLARSAEQVTLFDIVKAIDGPVLDPLPVSGHEADELREVWRQAAVGIERVLGSITLQQMCERARKSNMYYI